MLELQAKGGGLTVFTLEFKKGLNEFISNGEKRVMRKIRQIKMGFIEFMMDW